MLIVFLTSLTCCFFSILFVKPKESHICYATLFDVCADAPAPSWEELEDVTLAVKLVVHGLVEFIQNFSKKSHDAPQVTPS